MRTKISWKRNSTVIEVLAAAALQAAFMSPADRGFRNACLRQLGVSATAINLGQSYPFFSKAIAAVLLLEKACWKDGRMEKKRKRSIGF